VNGDWHFTGDAEGWFGRIGYLQIYSTITAVNEPPHGPTSFTLSQNYPNPFNPTTTISYDIPKLSYVTLVVYDILGRQVEELVNGEKTSGSYQAVFNASNLPSGVYFYRLQAGAYHDTKKLLLIK